MRKERRVKEGVEVEEELPYTDVRFLAWLLETLPLFIGTNVFILNN